MSEFLNQLHRSTGLGQGQIQGFFWGLAVGLIICFLSHIVNPTMKSILAALIVTQLVTQIVLGIWVQNLRTDRDWLMRWAQDLDKSVEYTQQQVSELQHRPKQ